MLNLRWTFLLLLLGLTLSATAAPTRVVSTTLMTDEYLVGLVAPNRILALSTLADDPVLSNVGDAARSVARRARLELESLVALAPDLVLVADWSDASAVAFLRQAGIAVEVVVTPRTWAEVKARIADLGRVLGAEAEAKAWAARLAAEEDRLAAVRRRIDRPATVLEYNSFGSSMGQGTLWNDLTVLAGVRNLAASLPVDPFGYAPLSRELLVRLDPDWLVLPSAAALSAYGQGDFLKDLEGDPLYRGLRAVTQSRVLFLSEALKTTTGPAALQAAAALQHAAYPNLR